MEANLNMSKQSPAHAPEIITVSAHIDQVMCDGGGGPLGHPVVYYTFDTKNTVECLYCDRVFVKSKGKKA